MTNENGLFNHEARRPFVAKSDSCLPGRAIRSPEPAGGELIEPVEGAKDGFLLKNDRSGYKKEAMNPGRGAMKFEWRMTTRP
jgi:hypothetical protein